MATVSNSGKAPRSRILRTFSGATRARDTTIRRVQQAVPLLKKMPKNQPVNDELFTQLNLDVAWLKKTLGMQEGVTYSAGQWLAELDIEFAAMRTELNEVKATVVTHGKRLDYVDEKLKQVFKMIVDFPRDDAMQVVDAARSADSFRVTRALRRLGWDDDRIKRFLVLAEDAELHKIPDSEWTAKLALILDAMQAEMDSKFKAQDERIDTVVTQVKNHEPRIKALEARADASTDDGLEPARRKVLIASIATLVAVWFITWIICITNSVHFWKATLWGMLFGTGTAAVVIIIGLIVVTRRDDYEDNDNFAEMFQAPQVPPAPVTPAQQTAGSRHSS